MNLKEEFKKETGLETVIEDDNGVIHRHFSN